MNLNGLKTLAVVLLTFFYSFCAVGMGVNVHYCHGKLASVSIGFSKEDCCCKKVTKRKCCSNKEVVLKIESKQIKTATYIWSEYQCLLPIQRKTNCFVSENTYCLANPQYVTLFVYPPPCPVYLRNRNIRI